MTTPLDTFANADASHLSRRGFLQSAALASTAALVGAGGCASGGTKRSRQAAPVAFRPERLRVGVIGCGGRGTGAAKDCVNAAEEVEIVALGDLFADRVEGSRKALAEWEKPQAIHADNCFVGFDAYQSVLSCDIDMVILATPPHFRPEHLAAAIAAGKHVFMEKPVAVDPVGIRAVMAASDEARARGLAIVAGTQRRHDPAYQEIIRRVHDGAIGELVGGQCYWNQGGLWVVEQTPEMSDMEWQCRNWLYFCWLSGDHIVEQHVHNLDVINWAMGGPPEKAVGMGGRQVRTEPKYGNIFDHFAVEYTYPSGAKVMSMCRQIGGCSDNVSERLVGTRGTCDPQRSIAGPKRFEYEPANGEWINPYVQEHRDLIASIRANDPLNEGRQVAESTMTAIMGRMSAYTGREISWRWLMNASQLDLRPPAYEFGPLAVDPVPMPGVTKLV